jgi:hypothetical protein
VSEQLLLLAAAVAAAITAELLRWFDRRARQRGRRRTRADD